MDKQKLLDWLNNEKKKDSVEVEKIKKDFANQLRAMKREDLFKKPKKTLSSPKVFVERILSKELSKLIDVVSILSVRSIDEFTSESFFK
jgi:hypothetical protein